MTIGVLMDWAESTYQVKIWSGVEDSAKDLDVNLVCFVSGALASPENPEKMHDRFFKLINRENIEGLVILTATFTRFIEQKTIIDFIRQFEPLPYVSIATPIPGAPSILTDNMRGMKELLSHLIDVHGYGRLAFITGTEGHSDARERYATYREVLDSRGIPFDPALVVQGDFSMLSGQAAIHELIDERKAKFDAIVASNDQMAIGALAALGERGINVPADVALAGFDDIGTYKTVAPPLTTVRQPLYKQGRRAFEILIDKIEGREVPLTEIIPTSLVLRESCGCFSKSVNTVRIGANGSELRGSNLPTDEHLEAIFSNIVKSFEPSFERMNAKDAQALKRRMEELFDAFTAELIFDESGTFISLWNETLSESSPAGSNASLWRSLLSAYHRHINLVTYTRFAGQKAELLIEQARRRIIEMEKRIKEDRQLETLNDFLAARELGEELVITADLSELRKLLAEVLPRFGIKCCYLSLYGEDEDANRYSQLILAFDENGIIAITPSDDRFAETKLVPDGLLPTKRRFSMMVDTLYHMDEQLGFGVLEIGPQEGVAYDVLRRRLRNAVKGALLLQQIEDQNLALERANAKLKEEMKIRRRIEKEILEVSGREQQRIGQDLHDDLGQKLTGIAFMCRVLEEKLDKCGMSEAADAAEITRLIDDSIEQSKRLARGLMPVDLEENGLINALGELAVKIESSSGISCTFSSTPDVIVNDNSVALHLFRIAQEAVNNAAKHSGCRRIAIELSVDRGNLSLSVRDDGVGLPDAIRSRKGIGLHIMNYRANIIDGTLDIRQNSPRGTIVECVRPYELPETRLVERRRYKRR